MSCLFIAKLSLQNEVLSVIGMPKPIVQQCDLKTEVRTPSFVYKEMFQYTTKSLAHPFK
ncbi:hypothetical protein HPP92_026064 [Vanilla planifolia]|nr:hypothetical protein HPP92_026064 [Vanilla planifolia]